MLGAQPFGDGLAAASINRAHEPTLQNRRHLASVPLSLPRPPKFPAGTLPRRPQKLRVGGALSPSSLGHAQADRFPIKTLPSIKYALARPYFACARWCLNSQFLFLLVVSACEHHSLCFSPRETTRDATE